MGRARRHHTVPAFYLRRFADANGQIERVAKSSGERTIMSVRNATVEVDFYTVETDEGPSDMIEWRLSEIESMAAVALQHLDQGEPPTPDDLTGLCNFIAIQITRGPDFREKIDDFNTQIMRKVMMLEAGLGPGRVAEIVERALGRPPTEEEVTEAMGWMSRGDYKVSLHPNRAINAMLEGASELVEPFSRMRWKVAGFEDPVLITSDRPVSLWVKDPLPPFYGVGVLTADEISLPISPTKAFVIYPNADTDTELEGPSAGELDRRTVNSANRWLFMNPGWIDRSKTLLEHQGT